MDKKFIEDAYRKLKGSVYFDKTLPFLRTRIVDYERGNIDRKLGNIYEAIHDEFKWTKLERKILESVKVLTFPKKIGIKNDDKTEGEPIVISNISGTNTVIEKYNNFIDLCIEGHIIGILWILTIGYKMDNDLYSNCYGNRLSNNLIFKNEKTTASPNLFKPYFKQYENWRNEGLKKAENTIKTQNKSVIITMLDLTRYYYNVEITDENYRLMTLKFYDNQDAVLNRIVQCIYNIIKKYACICGCQNGYMLPIGFLPSNIISNYYLKEFDTRMAKLQGTIYYGRYVDDMILVTEIKDDTKLQEQILSEGSRFVSDYMFEQLEKANILCKEESGEYSLGDFPKLNFHKNKLRFFYINKDGNNTIIEKIQDDICKNASEFNFLPETAMEELSTDILKIEREDTVNKLRSINSATIDKYVLSKSIGKNIMMSKFAEEKTVKRFARSLEQVLNHQEILNNYTLWESILNYYVINNYTEKIGSFSRAIYLAIEHMNEEENKRDSFKYLKNKKVQLVGDSLVYYYFSCLMRVTSISWGQSTRQVLEEIIFLFTDLKKYKKYQYLYTMQHINQTRKAYCNARMVNKNLLPVTIEDCMSAFKPNDTDVNINVFSLDNYLKSNLKCKFGVNNQKYAPYIQSPFEILYSALINQIRDGKKELLTDQECVKLLCRKYAENFGRPNGKYISPYISTNCYDGEHYVIKVKTDKQYKNTKVRIAVANVKMNETDIEDVFKDNRRDIYHRCKEIGKILNEAIRHKSDIIVFPEAYIPLEYLKILQAKVSEHNMVIIGGIEHIKHGNIVYNLTTTIIPIKNRYMSYAVPFFHQKLYFSPHESEIVKKFSCEPAKGQSHTLFKWCGINFASYCCYELTSISLRHTFQGMADIICGVEWNKDTYYFGNIMEALSRDIYCYCVQANMSEYGDSRIIQPTKKDTMNVLKVKGGINASVLIGEVDIKKLRNFQKNKVTDSNLEGFKPLPAGWDLAKVIRK